MTRRRSKALAETLARLVLCLVGLCVAHLGVALFLLTVLGSDPFNVFVQGLFWSIPWPGWVTFGTVHLVVSLIILLILLTVDRKLVGWGTLLCMALGGPIIDLWSLLLSPVVRGELHLALRLALLVLGCVILAFGMTLVISSQAGTGPNDLVAVAISEKLRLPFGPVRMGVDLCFTAIGFRLGGVVGVGTLICAFLVGPVAQLFFPVSRRICDGGVKRITGERRSPGGDI